MKCESIKRLSKEACSRKSARTKWCCSGAKPFTKQEFAARSLRADPAPPSVCQSVLSACLSVCLSVWLSVCLSVCLSCLLVGIRTTFWKKLAARMLRTSQNQLAVFHQMQLYKNHSQCNTKSAPRMITKCHGLIEPER